MGHGKECALLLWMVLYKWEVTMSLTLFGLSTLSEIDEYRRALADIIILLY